MTRALRSTAGFTMVEILVSLVILSFGAMVLGQLMLQGSRASRVRSTATYRTAALTQEVERLGVIPFDSVIVSSSCTTVSADPFPHSLCTTVTSISTVSRQATIDRDTDRRLRASARHGRPGPHRPAPRRAAEHPVSPVSRSFRRGFTLVELLISMIVLAIVGAGLVQMVMSQGRFMDHQEAWRSSRGRLPEQPQPAVLPTCGSSRRWAAWRQRRPAARTLPCASPMPTAVMCSTNGTATTLASCRWTRRCSALPGSPGFAWRNSDRGLHTM